MNTKLEDETKMMVGWIDPDWWSFFLNHFPLDSEPDLQVLKGHLIIEQTLNKLIEFGVRNPKRFKDEDYNFYIKIKLARALVDRDFADEDWIWDAVKTFNTLRNKAAHYLDGDLFDKWVKTFVDHMMKHDPYYQRTGSIEKEYRLRLAIVRLFVVLSAPVEDAMHPPAAK